MLVSQNSSETGNLTTDIIAAPSNECTNLKTKKYDNLWTTLHIPLPTYIRAYVDKLQVELTTPTNNNTINAYK